MASFIKIKLYGINIDTDKEQDLEIPKNVQASIEMELEEFLEANVIKESSKIGKALDPLLKEGFELEYEVSFVKGKK